MVKIDNLKESLSYLKEEGEDNVKFVKELEIIIESIDEIKIPADFVNLQDKLESLSEKTKDTFLKTEIINIINDIEKLVNT